MKYAIIKSGGKQYKVSEGDIIKVERLSVKPNQDFIFEDVLLCVLDNSPKIGKPRVSNVTVKGKVLEEIRGEKIRVSKYKAKVRHRRTTGHRQYLSKVKIEKIEEAHSKEESSNEVKKMSKSRKTIKK